MLAGSFVSKLADQRISIDQEKTEHGDVTVYEDAINIFVEVTVLRPSFCINDIRFRQSADKLGKKETSLVTKVATSVF